jgi:hypothetical protein
MIFLPFSAILTEQTVVEVSILSIRAIRTKVHKPTYFLINNNANDCHIYHIIFLQIKKININLGFSNQEIRFIGKISLIKNKNLISPKFLNNSITTPNEELQTD